MDFSSDQNLPLIVFGAVTSGFVFFTKKLLKDTEKKIDLKVDQILYDANRETDTAKFAAIEKQCDKCGDFIETAKKHIYKEDV